MVKYRTDEAQSRQPYGTEHAIFSGFKYGIDLHRDFREFPRCARLRSIMSFVVVHHVSGKNAGAMYHALN